MDPNKLGLTAFLRETRRSGEKGEEAEKGDSLFFRDVSSAAQSRNDDRNPCGTAAISFRWSSWRSCLSASGFPPPRVKTSRAVPSSSVRASSRITFARRHRCTRCSRLAFMRVSGNRPFREPSTGLKKGTVYLFRDELRRMSGELPGPSKPCRRGPTLSRQAPARDPFSVRDAEKGDSPEKGDSLVSSRNGLVPETRNTSRSSFNPASPVLLNRQINGESSEFIGRFQ